MPLDHPWQLDYFSFMARSGYHEIKQFFPERAQRPDEWRLGITQTYHLLCEHVSEAISVIIEGYLVPERPTDENIAFYGHFELATSWVEPKLALLGATRGGHVQLVKHLLARVGFLGDYCIYALQLACESGDQETIDYWLKEIARPDLDAGLYGSCKAGNMKVMANMIARGATQCACWLSLEQHRALCADYLPKKAVSVHMA